MIDIPFLKSQVLNLESQFAEAVKTMHEINGGLTYARNLLAHAEQQLAEANEKAAAEKANESPCSEPQP